MVETIKLNRLRNIDRAYNGINQEEANKQRDRIDRKISFKELKQLSQSNPKLLTTYKFYTIRNGGGKSAYWIHYGKCIRYVYTPSRNLLEENGLSFDESQLKDSQLFQRINKDLSIEPENSFYFTDDAYRYIHMSDEDLDNDDNVIYYDYI